MKKTFRKKLRCVIEIEGYLEIDYPLEDCYNESSSGQKRGERIRDVRSLKRNQTENLKKLDPKSFDKYHIKVSQVKSENSDFPVNSQENFLCAGSCLGVEFPFLKDHLQSSLESFVRRL